MAPELETLDQLIGSDLPVSLIRSLFSDDDRFILSIGAMLEAGEIRLIGPDDAEIPKWQRREILTTSQDGSRLTITDIGTRRMA